MIRRMNTVCPPHAQYGQCLQEWGHLQFKYRVRLKTYIYMRDMIRVKVI